MQFRYPVELIPSENQVIARVVDVPEAITLIKYSADTNERLGGCDDYYLDE